MVGLIGSLRGSSYKIPNSLRFRANASMHLSRTPTVVGNRKTWTWSGWVKIGNISSVGTLFGNVANQYEQHYFGFNNGALAAYFETSNGTTKTLWTTTSVFRDPSAWYHVVVVFDTTQSTITNMCKFYVNGSLQVITISNESATYLTQNQNGYINSSDLHTIGSGLPYYSGRYFDGYMAEVNFIDGQALAPSSFGRISGSTGVWSPKKYTGTYGTNGFYLNFKDNSAATSAAIGKDYSGNYNNWTPNNISLIAGTSYDSMVDSPTPYGDSLQYFTGTRYPYNALNFRSSASTYLSRTFNTPTNANVWSLSLWFKRMSTSTDQCIISTATRGAIWINAANQIAFFNNAGSSIATSTAIFQDLSQWEHLTVINNGTTVKAYRNNVEILSWTQTGWLINTALTHYIGFNTTLGPAAYFNGYMADINFIDGQALTPSSFGETVNGIWKPKTYTGTYGTNGFYLKFNDNSAATATALGKDSAGSNNWTPTNLAVTDVTSTDITSVKLVNPNYGLQFRSSASTCLNKTFVTPTDQNIWTFSAWVKRSSIGGSIYKRIFDAYDGTSAASGYLYFDTDDTIAITIASGGVQVAKSAAVFRDTSTWYHIVVKVNVTTSTQIIYVNNAQVASYPISVSTGATQINKSGAVHKIGGSGLAGTAYFDGIIAEVNFIDGQALAPSSFGETIDGTWVPKLYIGTYGTNGFYLNFANRSAMTDTAIGNDASSNNNNWTPNNLVISDAIDYTTKTARGNYCVFNPLDGLVGSVLDITEGNLKIYNSSGGSYNGRRTTIAMTQNKWYMEFSIVSQGGAGRTGCGLYRYDDDLTKYAGYAATSWGYHSNGSAYTNSVATIVSTGAYAVGDIIMMAFDATSGYLWFGKNGTWNGNPNSGTGSTYSGITSGPYFWGGWGWNTSDTTVSNFGQRPFAYTPPAGFKALNTYNLPAPAITNAASYMAATTYTGTGAALTVNNITNNKTFKPDLVWIKSRSAATDNALYDSVRGVQKDLVSNNVTAETTQTAGLLAFNDNGFNIGTLSKLNTNAATYVAWQWKAGGSTVANTAGTIASQVNANPAAGFSIVSYAGTGGAGTVGHGLGIAPKLVIIKNRTGTADWRVWPGMLGTDSNGIIYLNSTEGIGTSNVLADWNSSNVSLAMTSSVISVGINSSTSGNNFIAYCFAEVAGYSKFGSYTGNGSADGPFVYCGFRPRWVMIRSTVGDGPGGTRWIVIDASRDSTNPTAYALSPNFASEEIVIAHWKMDFVSNGFKIRSYLSNDREWNYPSSTYIFAAFAETPFKYSLAR